MEAIDLTLFEHSLPALLKIRSLLIQFEQYNNVHVNLRLIPPKSGRQRLLEIAFNQAGADVSEINIAWLCDFARMKSFHPFSPRELGGFELQDQFIQSCWEPCELSLWHGHKNTWAVPWSAHVPGIYYRKDLLDKASIDPQTAFDSLEHLDQTFDRLMTSGVRLPLLIPTHSVHSNLVNLVMWVWDRNGDLVDSSGEHLAFDQPAARQGMYDYYGLWRYLAKDVRHMKQWQVEHSYKKGLGAVMIADHLLLQDERIDPQLRENIALAGFPGTAHVGGTHLAIWEHAKNMPIALELAKFLTSRQAGELLYPHLGLPIRHDILETKFYVRDPHYQVFTSSLRSGRCFPNGTLASILYKQLSKHVTGIWEDIFRDTRPQLNGIVDQHIEQILEDMEKVVLEPL